MRATIHQSYFLPWLGYFSKLAFSDTFVVLDNVDFRKRHFFDRTKYINMHGEVKWLSLPVGQNFGKKCNEVFVRQPDKKYIDSIIRTIELSYAKALCFDNEWPELKDSILKPLIEHTSLVEINIAIIKNILSYLNLKIPKIYFSSQLNCIRSDSTERIIKICDSIKIKSIVIGGGMSINVHNWSKIQERGISIFIQNYLSLHPKYVQYRRKREGFQKGLTIIDAILNAGRDQTRSFIYNDFYKPKSVKLL